MKPSDAKDLILEILTTHHEFWTREPLNTSVVLLKLLAVGCHVQATGYRKEMCLHEDKHSPEKLWIQTLNGSQESFLHCLPKPSASTCSSIRKGYFVSKRPNEEVWMMSHQTAESKCSVSNHSTLTWPRSSSIGCNTVPCSQRHQQELCSAH